MNCKATQALLNASRVRGLYTKVAKSLGVSVQHVREVALGRRQSDRIAKAVDREFAKMQARDRAA